jgi:hypothetical protein
MRIEMDIRSTKAEKTNLRKSIYIDAIKHMGKLSLKIETITDQVEKMILEYKKININSPQISPEEASYNVGAVDALTKVLEMLKEQP